MLYSKFFEEHDILFIFNHPELWYGKNNSLRKKLYNRPYDQPCIHFYFFKKEDGDKLELNFISLVLERGNNNKFYIPMNSKCIEDLIEDENVIIEV